MDASNSSDRWIYRIGGFAAIVGSLLAMIGNLLHPMTPTGDPVAVGHAIHGSDAWTVIHMAIVIGLILMLGGLMAIADSMHEPFAAAMARFGWVAADCGRDRRAHPRHPGRGGGEAARRRLGSGAGRRTVGGHA